MPYNHSNSRRDQTAPPRTAVTCHRHAAGETCLPVEASAKTGLAAGGRPPSTARSTNKLPGRLGGPSSWRRQASALQVLCLLTLVFGLWSPASAENLPSGPGLADKFPADTDISSHQSVIFADNFEAKTFPKPWDSARDDDGDVLSFIEPADPRLGKRALRVTATLGKNTGGGPTKWFKSADTLFIRFYCRFDNTSDYIHHFVTLRANKSLQGKDKWSGFGGAGLRPKGDDRFSTALEPWGDNGRTPPPGRWNFYSYWPDMKRDPDGNFWGNAFRPATQPDIVRGSWICAEFMLRHNTPGKPDGQQAFWIDGQLRGHWKNINWRTSPTLWANALTLEAYVTDRWTKNKTNIVDFDNLVIARSYIGPSPRKNDGKT